jgi:hypothetical protein
MISQHRERIGDAVRRSVAGRFWYDALGAAYAREAQWEQSEKSFLRAMEYGRGDAGGNLLY